MSTTAKMMSMATLTTIASAKLATGNRKHREPRPPRKPSTQQCPQSCGLERRRVAEPRGEGQGPAPQGGGDGALAPGAACCVLTVPPRRAAPRGLAVGNMRGHVCCFSWPNRKARARRTRTQTNYSDYIQPFTNSC